MFAVNIFPGDAAKHRKWSNFINITLNRELKSVIEKDIYTEHESVHRYTEHVRDTIIEQLVIYITCEEYCEIDENKMIDRMLDLTIAEDDCDQLVSYLCLFDINKETNIWKIVENFYTIAYRKYHCLLRTHYTKLHGNEQVIAKAIDDLGTILEYILGWHYSY